MFRLPFKQIFLPKTPPHPCFSSRPSLYFFWVQVHCGIAGNEKVDLATGRAMSVGLMDRSCSLAGSGTHALGRLPFPSHPRFPMAWAPQTRRATCNVSLSIQHILTSCPRFRSSPLHLNLQLLLTNTSLPLPCSNPTMSTNYIPKSEHHSHRYPLQTINKSSRLTVLLGRTLPWFFPPQKNYIAVSFFI